MFEIKDNRVVLLGDSTIDNRVWVEGLLKNYITTLFGIKNDSIAVRLRKSRRRFFPVALSIFENLTVRLPQCDIRNYANDGFTTADVLYGGYRDKVFGEGTFSLYPHEFFEPLKSAETAIRRAQFVVLSVGGNNFREFLLEAMSARKNQRDQYIRHHFFDVMDQMKKQYRMIYDRIRTINPGVMIILMTQYYPSFCQRHYRIYEFMQDIGICLKLGTQPEDARTVIHEIIKITYSDILTFIDTRYTALLDVTSSLDPFDRQNHVHQIEPSGAGSQKIADMIAFLVQCKDSIAGKAFRFPADFFKDSKSVIVTDLSEWVPLPPDAFLSKE